MWGILVGSSPVCDGPLSCRLVLLLRLSSPQTVPRSQQISEKLQWLLGWFLLPIFVGLFGSSSGPAALSTLMLRRSLNIPSSSITSGGISSSTRVETLGFSWFPSLVNVDTILSTNSSLGVTDQLAFASQRGYSNVTFPFWLCVVPEGLSVVVLQTLVNDLVYVLRFCFSKFAVYTPSDTSCMLTIY